MKTLFDITSGRISGNPYILLAEIGEQHCCVGHYNKEDNSIDVIRYFEFDQLHAKEALDRILSGYHSNEAGKAIFTFCFPEAVLVPQKFSSSASGVVQHLFPMRSREVFQDRIAEWQIVTAYSVPRYIQGAISRLFSSSEFYHSYTAMLRQRFTFDGSQLYINFQRAAFSVMLKLDDQIHLVQTYRYSTPLDVVYYLLKISYEFGLQQNELKVILSGLVEKESSLFSEIQQYFSQLYFTPAPDIVIPENDYPHYYFQSLYNIAACVL